MRGVADDPVAGFAHDRQLWNRPGDRRSGFLGPTLLPEA